MTTTRAEEYVAMGHHLLEKGREALEQDDLIQASEKLWGATAQIVKAVAERRGWRRGGHRDLFQITERLAKETGDSSLADLFHVANSLHSNFYEHWMSRYLVEQGSARVQELVEKLEAL